MNEPPRAQELVKQKDFLTQIIERTSETGIVINPSGNLDYSTFTGLITLSEVIMRSGIHPESLDSTSKIAIVIARGRSVGLDPFQSMDSFYVVNGRATLYGSVPLALARQHPAWDESGFAEWFEVDGQRVNGSQPIKFDSDQVTACCSTLRKGAKAPLIRRFSVADAKRGGLWNNPKKLYGTYPQRLLPARARSYNLQDNFGDALKGIAIREVSDEEYNSISQEAPVESGSKENHGSNQPSRGNDSEPQAQLGVVDSGGGISGLKASLSEQLKAKRSRQKPEKKDEGSLQASSEVLKLRQDIMNALFSRGFDEEEMNKVLKEASGLEYDSEAQLFHRWMELDTLKTCDDVDWMRAILDRLKS